MHTFGKPFPCTSLCSFIMDSVADGVFTVDLDWNVIFFNSSAARITGRPAHEAVGRKCWELFRTRDCPGSCLLRAAIAEDRTVGNRVLIIERGDGGQLPVSVSASPLKDNEGRVIGGVESFRDLSGVGLVAGLSRHADGEGFCTRDPALAEVIAILPQIAESGSTVLLLGESGTGKEVLARAIHKLSERRSGPFVGVNCGALPENLMESELFGYKAGAFTDARRDKPGRFGLAAGGTILLDEIGDLPLPLQAKILRVLQERSFEPLGSVASVAADVRVIAATNRDLERMVEEGAFRRDLYYRLNVVQLRLPALRDRQGDIPLLVDTLVRRRRAATGKDIEGVSQAALAVLLAHPYPGNVRELENIIEYASILCPGGLIEVEHLPAHLRPRAGAATGGLGPRTLAAIRLAAAREAVERNGGNRNAACRELNISKDTLRRILRGGSDAE